MPKHALFFSFNLISILFLISCGPSGRRGIDESKWCVPHDLNIISVDNSYAKIGWDAGCPGTRIMRGFNIYLSPDPIVKKYSGHELPSSIQPYNTKIFQGDGEGDLNSETYEVKGITNHNRYFAHVRAVYNDGMLSVPSNEVEITCYPQGTIELGVSFVGDKSGFSFVNDDYCDTDDLENDIYYFHKNGEDFLCSPARLSQVNRSTRLFMAGRGTLPNDLTNLVGVGDPGEKISVSPGQNIVIQTEDGLQAKIYIRNIRGKDSDRILIIDYVFPPSYANPAF